MNTSESFNFGREVQTSKPQDYYSILGVSRNATNEEIKNAYKKLLIKYHPDKFAARQGSKEARHAQKMLETIKNAQDVLGNPKSRARYDAGELKFDAGEEPEKSEMEKPSYEEIQAKHNLAKEQIYAARTIEEVKKIINEYNELFGKFANLGKRLYEMFDFEICVGGVVYELNRSSGAEEGLSLKEVKQFKVGDIVKVEKSSGGIDDGWRIDKISEGDMLNGKVISGKLQFANVSKKLGGQVGYKTFPLKKIREYNK